MFIFAHSNGEFGLFMLQNILFRIILHLFLQNIWIIDKKVVPLCTFSCIARIVRVRIPLFIYNNIQY